MNRRVYDTKSKYRGMQQTLGCPITLGGKAPATQYARASVTHAPWAVDSCGPSGDGGRGSAVQMRPLRNRPKPT